MTIKWALNAEYLHLLLLNSGKLRARQKERLARIKAIKESNPAEGFPGNELLSHSPAIAKGGDPVAGPMHSDQEGPSINLEDRQLSEAKNSNTDSFSRINKLSEQSF